MGHDLVAYFDVDQDDLERFVRDNNIDRNDWNQCKLVSDRYKTKHLQDHPKLFPVYCWNEECQIHEMFEMYGTNFIRDDERFDNRRFQAILAKKVGREFPCCLKNINWTVRTSYKALEVAEELAAFFAEDKSLMHFAEWLRQTAQHCSTYELSY